jgi:pyridoxal phosphate enzyme (YggS family)
MIDIQANLASISNEIQSLIAQNPALSVPRLIAVSKKQPVSALQEAIAAGQRDFGENYLQEAIQKMELINDDQVVWHFIGPVQTNKTRMIAQNFDWVHTVDRIKIAQRLSDQRPADLPPIKVCLQVNIDADNAKAGVLPEHCASLVAEVMDLPGLELRGLMTITSVATDDGERRESFKRLNSLLREIGAKYPVPQFDTLSMGMSSDWRLAVLEGATMIRLGTSVFGPRQ